MGLAIVLATMLLGPQDPSSPPPAGGEEARNLRKVQVKDAWFYRGPSRVSGVVRKADDGEEVIELGAEGRFVKVRARRDGLVAYLLSGTIVPPEKFKRSAADEKEGKALAAQGLEGQRGLNPETEREYRSQGGAAREKAYQELDGLMNRRPYATDRAALERRLQEFRQAGKLGEFASVK
ncbi:MAG TPA: hypothetical protein VNO22_10720 [Planctomycetota bacterium]|jgi:hypothetical protein|nr:hypothetical protein [Planctomycetota bacterium]